MLATFSSTLLVDRAGRKILLTISAFVMCLCLGTLGIYFHLKDTNTTDLSNMTTLPVASVALFLIVFSIGFGPIPWMMIGELFPNKLKGIAGSISAAFNWTLAFTVTKLFQNMINTFGSGLTFGIFGIICGAGTIFVILMVPETKGKDISEVQRILAGGESKKRADSFDESEEDVVTINIKKWFPKCCGSVFVFAEART